MWSISETIEKGNVFVTASPSLWIDEHILYWPPPGEQIDRSTISTPGPDWIPHMCRVLKDKIGKINFFLQITHRARIQLYFNLIFYAILHAPISIISGNKSIPKHKLQNTITFNQHILVQGILVKPISQTNLLVEFAEI